MRGDAALAVAEEQLARLAAHAAHVVALLLQRGERRLERAVALARLQSR